MDSVLQVHVRPCVLVFSYRKELLHFPWRESCLAKSDARWVQKLESDLPSHIHVLNTRGKCDMARLLQVWKEVM
jgi:hypothetical protein